MPIHDWTRVSAGVYHDFHCTWIPEIKRALNGGVLPQGYFAMTEQHGHAVHVDVMTLRAASAEPARNGGGAGGIAVAQTPPKVAVTSPASEAEMYALKRRTVTIRHESDDRIVALIEILSPSNKDRAQSVSRFVQKCWSALDSGFHLLIVDLFPPNVYCSRGIHAEIWQGYAGEPVAPPVGKPLVAASYDAGEPLVAYYEPLAVGDELPTMPLFIEPEMYVELPLAQTYDRAIDNTAPQILQLLENSA